MNAMVTGDGTERPAGTSGENGIVVIDAQAGEVVTVPGGQWVLGADFVRQGADLLLVGEDGQQVLIKGYFAQAEAPDLVLDGDARLDGDLVLKLAGPVTPGMVAQAGPMPGTEAIGKVETVEGTVTARHADGQEVALHKGDPVFQGDVLETGPAGAVGIVFADQTTFSLADNARMTLDEMVYDPATQEGSFKASLVQGVFSFISGEVAKTGPEAMVISTPVATIGIRGTTGAINLPQGETLTVVLTADAGGTVGEMTVSNQAGVQVLNAPFQATNVAGLNLPPSTTFTMSAEQFNSTFGQALAALPSQPAPGDSGGDGNDGAGDGQPGGEGGGDGTGDAGQGEGEGDGTQGDGEPAAGQEGQGDALMAAIGNLTLTGTEGQAVNAVVANLLSGLLTGQIEAGPIAVGPVILPATAFTPTDDNTDNTFFDDFQEVLNASTGNDALVGSDLNTEFDMSQGTKAAVPSGNLGGTDTVDGGDGIDQITFDNLWHVSGKLDALTSTLYLWNWPEVSGTFTPVNPQTESTSTAISTVTFKSVELFWFGSYDGSENLQFPNFTLGGEFVGQAIAGGDGDDTINDGGGWFTDPGAVVVFGGAGNDVIYGGDGANKLSGGAGDDHLYTPTGSLSWLEGGDGNDLLSTGVDQTIMNGGAGDDTFELTSAANETTMNGGSGDDTFNLTYASGGISVIGGETGETDGDTVDYTGMTGSSVDFTVTSTVEASHSNVGDSLQQVEVLKGTNSGDLYHFMGTDDPGLVSIIGGTGNDVFNFEAGATTSAAIDGGGGTDSVTLATGERSLSLSNVESVTGSSGTEALTLTTSVSGLSIDLGGGSDTLQLADGGNSVNVTDIEAVYGGGGGDAITILAASTAATTVTGGAAADTIVNAGSGSMTIAYTATGDFGDTVQGFNAATSILSVQAANIPVSYNLTDGNGDPVYEYLAVSQTTLDSGAYLATQGIINLTTGFVGYDDAATVATKLVNLHGNAGGWDALVVTGDSGNANSQVWYWSDTSGDAQITSDELTAVAKLEGCDNTTLSSSSFDIV